MNKSYSLGTIIIGFFSGALGAVVVISIFFMLLLPQGELGPYSFINSMSRLSPQASPNGQRVAVTPQIGQESSVVDAVKKAKPAVVSIVISKDIPIIERYYDENQSDPFNQFFGMPFNFQMPQYRQNGTQQQEIGGGSGFLVSSDGLIVTNKHVVSDETADYTVFTNDGKKHTATVVARDPVNDLAVIKIDGTGYPYLQFGNSDQLEAGQSVIAIGNALAQFQNTVSVGVISGLSRSITAGDGTGSSENLENVIQTDAAINPGNSGGPLLSLDGTVIGVNVAIVQGSQNIGFALPSSIAKNVVESVKKTGKIVRPYLGVRYVQINADIKQKNNLTVDYGALITRGATRDELAILPGSPADKAGLVENDIILEFDGTKLDDTHSLSTLTRQKNVGDTITLKILHQGTEKTVQVKLAEMPS